MVWLLCALSAIAFVEILLALPVMPALGRLLATARQAQAVIGSSRISDHWKEKALVVYAGRLLGRSLQIAGLLFFACAAVAAGGYLAALPLDSDFLDVMTSTEGVTVATVLSLGYVFVRSHFVSR